MNEDIALFLSQRYPSIVQRTFTSFICTDDSETKRFIKVISVGSSLEKEILEDLDHPNIIRLIESIKIKGSLLLEFPLIYGAALFFKRDILNLKSVCIELISAISYLIDKGYIHCDITPSNILISSQKLYLIDFSHAIIVGESNSVYPTIFHAPEVLNGNPHKYSDLYSLGVIILYLLLKDKDFEVPINSPGGGRNILNGFIKSSCIDTKISNLALGLLELDPNKRVSYFCDIQKIMCEAT